MAKTLREQIREEVQPFRDDTKAHIQANYGSTVNFVLHGLASVFKWVALIFAAFIAAILNLARKS